MQHGVVPSWPQALELTPNQTVRAIEALAAARSGTSAAPRRRGTKAEFIAAVMGAVGR